MAEELEPYDDPSLKGIHRYLNSNTKRGRANVSKLTLSLVFIGFVWYKLTKWSKKPADS